MLIRDKRTRALSTPLLFCVIFAAVLSTGCESENLDATGQSTDGTATTHAGASSADTTQQSPEQSAVAEQSAPQPATSERSSISPAAPPDTSVHADGPNSCLPLSEPPKQLDCQYGTTDDGRWRPLPCACELWVDSPSNSELSASISLSFARISLISPLDVNVSANVTFPDADASWFEVWQQQSETSMQFTVTHSQEGTTTVRLVQPDVNLDPVRLTACESRHAQTSFDYIQGGTLRIVMLATLVDSAGNPVATTSVECEQSNRHPTVL